MNEPKRFAFVSGDIGGARAQLPVARGLMELGHCVNIVADSDGLAGDVWKNAKIDFISINPRKSGNNKSLHQIINDNDLLFVNTCASASEVELTLTKLHQFRMQFPDASLVLGSDGFFNHAFPKWQNAFPDYWFAINEGHAQAIKYLRPWIPEDTIRVVGQPAFDVVLDLIPRKEEIRKQRRVELGIAREIMILWWSQGMGNLIEEDIAMAKCALKTLASKNVVFVPKLHPKLEKIREGYLSEISNQFKVLCQDFNIRMINASEIPNEELNLAADVILSITCTEDIKNVLMGGPPVVHLLGPVARKWMEEELFLKPPYLPDLIIKQSLAVFSPEQVGNMIIEATKPEVKEKLLSKWEKPTERAMDKTVKELLNIAQAA